MIIRIKKRNLLIATVFTVFAVLIPLIYAVGENAVRIQSFKVELAISNRNPTINVSNLTGGGSSFSVDTLATGDVKVLISFNVTDADGAGNINASTAVVNFTLGDTSGQYFSNISAVASSEFGTCNNHSPSSTVVVINCSVVLPYFANASAAWVINISVKDIFGGVGRNDTGIFTINTVSGLSLPITFVNFTNVNLGQQNVPSSPLTINNTGNEDFDTINVSAALLRGTTTTTETIAATNFYANITNETAGLGVQLATTPVTLRELVQSTSGTGLDNATLVHGHTSSSYTIIKDKGNRTIFFWVDVPTGSLSSQLYNATWNITVINNP